MRYIKGNLLDTPLNHICHGCNGIGVMGAGVAYAIKKKWPKVYEDYQKELAEYKMDHPYQSVLGQVFSSDTGDKIIDNIITQKSIGTETISARYYAVIEGLKRVIAKNHFTNKFAIPKIGCGLGGLDWNVVEIFVKELEKDYNVEFWVYEL